MTKQYYWFSISKKISLLFLLLLSSIKVLNGSAPAYFWRKLSNSQTANVKLQEETAEQALQYFPRELIVLIGEYARTYEPIAQYYHPLKSCPYLIKRGDELIAVAPSDDTYTLITHQVSNEYQKLASQKIKLPNNNHPALPLNGYVADLPNGPLLCTRGNNFIDCNRSQPNQNPSIIERLSEKLFPSFSGIYTGHANKINCLIVLPNGNILSGSNDKTIKEWQANNPRAIHTYKGHTDGVTCLAALSRGNFISASKDNTIKEWKSKAEKPLISYESADSQKPMAVTCLTELANDNFIAGSSDGTITEWSPAEKAVVRTYKAHSKEITCLARLDNGNFLSGSMDGTIKQWKPGTLKPIAMYPLFDTVALSITVNTDQTFIVPLGNDQLYMFSSDVRTDLEKAIDSPRHKAKQTGK